MGVYGVPNSADKSSRTSNALAEDSDVIELTDEVRSKLESSSAFGDPDSIDFAMPEFKLPELSDFEEDSDPSSSASFEATQRLDASALAHQSPQLPDDLDDEPEFEQTAILKPRQQTEEIDISTEGLQIEPTSEPIPNYSDRPHHKTMQIDLNDLGSLEEISYEEFEQGAAVPDEIGDDLPAFSQNTEHSTAPIDEPSNDPYDREEMVKTLQMQAVDRDAIERQIEQERLKLAKVIADQRFAPDVLATPPRVLTKRWQEWPLEEAQPSQETSAPTMSGPPPSLKGAQTPNRAPQPSGPQSAVPSLQGAPRPASAPHSSVQRQPNRPSNAQTTPAAAPAPATAPVVKPSTGDAELDGLVQELLDESTKKEAPKPRAKSRSGQPGRDSWFKEVFTEEYFRSIPPNLEQQTEREIQFIEQSLGLESGARLLDLACGYGRHSIGLAQRQIEVVGLDLSMDMLQRALAQAQRRALSIKFIHADMRSLSFNEVFDGCLLWQSSFGYFDDISNFKVLQGIWRSLKPGGRFLLDVLNRDHVVAQMPSRCWWEGQGCIFLEEVDFDHAQSVLHTKRSFIYEDGSPPLEQNMYTRMYSLHEIANLVTNAGFRVHEISGDLHHRGRFLGPSNARLIVLAEKILPPQKKA